MAQKVTLTVEHEIEIGNVDVTFRVRNGNHLVGTLTISKGSIDWRRANARKSVQKSWADFAALMDS